MFNKNYSLAEFIHIGIRLHKIHTFLENTKKSDRNVVKDQSIHLETNIRVGQ